MVQQKRCSRVELGGCSQAQRCRDWVQPRAALQGLGALSGLGRREEGKVAGD